MIGLSFSLRGEAFFNLRDTLQLPLHAAPSTHGVAAFLFDINKSLNFSHLAA